MRVNREKFLNKLELVQPGLSSRDMVEQGDCFLFKDKKVLTYNDEIFCSCKIPGLPFTGAVPAKPLVTLLRKMTDSIIMLEGTDKEIKISSKNGRNRAGLRLEKTISVQLSLETPTEWMKIPDEFGDAISIVQGCAGKNANTFSLTCIHIHPNWIEATNRFQACRYTLDTGVEESVLIAKDSAKFLPPMGADEFSVTKSWIHFRNSGGLVISMRAHLVKFPSLEKVLAKDGRKAVLPTGMKDTIGKAEIFSSESSDDNDISVKLKGDKLVIKGESIIGWYSETKTIKYGGPEISFMVSPALFSEITVRYNECEISDKIMKVTGDNWTYVTCLGQKDE